jgi:hypothetical protein
VDRVLVNDVTTAQMISLKNDALILINRDSVADVTGVIRQHQPPQTKAERGSKPK